MYGETKEKPIDSVLTPPLEVTKATTKATEVNGFTSEKEVQETCQVESQV